MITSATRCRTSLCYLTGADYERGRVLLTGDANTEVLVDDSRWTTPNLLLEQFNPCARLTKGLQKSMCCVEAGFDRLAVEQEVTATGIWEGGASAQRDPESHSPCVVDGPLTYTLEWNPTTIALICEDIPSVSKLTPLTTSHTVTSPSERMPVIVGQQGIYS